MSNIKIRIIRLTSNVTQVLHSDFNETLHSCRAIKNNRQVFFYIGGNFKGGNCPSHVGGDNWLILLRDSLKQYFPHLKLCLRRCKNYVLIIVYSSTSVQSFIKIGV